MTVAEVRLWGRTIGAVSLEDGSSYAAFQYELPFARSGIEVSPITMPLRDQVYVFSDLPLRTFHGLPGLLADSLPDRFGNALIDAWLATQGRTPDSFNAVERLCYTGERGMGAVEFAPAIGPKPQQAKKIDIDALVKLASEVLSHRRNLKTTFASASRRNALNDILRVGTSAGGARAKAVIAWNRETNEVRSGQITAGEGFEYWLLKFDDVTGNKDKELEDPKGYGAIEYAYYLMAKAAGVTMSECRLLEEGGRRHFMTRRFDRLDGGEKLHMQSLCALAHFDFNNSGAYAYEQAFLVIRQLNLPMGKPGYRHPHRHDLGMAEAALGKLQKFISDPSSPPDLVQQAKQYEASLREVAAFLLDLKHNFAFVGNIAVGKTTALCYIVDLLIKEATTQKQ